MLSASQVYELDGFRVTHASRYPAPVLSLGLSPDCGLLAVGTADGALSVRRHARPKAAAPGTPGGKSDSAAGIFFDGLGFRVLVARRALARQVGPGSNQQACLVLGMPSMSRPVAIPPWAAMRVRCEGDVCADPITWL